MGREATSDGTTGPSHVDKVTLKPNLNDENMLTTPASGGTMSAVQRILSHKCL